MPTPDPELPTLENLQERINRLAHGDTRKQEDDANETSSTLAQTAQQAWGVVSGASVGILGGYGLDYWLHTSPIFLIAGMFAGFGAGVFALVRNVNK